MAKLPTEIAQHEPREAFNGGPLGVSILSRLVKDGADYLVSGGLICCEVGLGQGRWLAQRFERTNNFQRVKTFSDSAGEIRVVAAQRK
jgi:release factor glutamine methyltransferase